MSLFFRFYNAAVGVLPNVRNADLSLERRVLRLEKEFNDLKQNNTTLTSEVAILKLKDKSVAFFAYLVNEMVNPSPGQTVIFSGVDINVGNAYDPVHGVFVAPISGTYHFAVVVSGAPDLKPHFMQLLLKKNDGSNQMLLLLDDNIQYWLRRSASSVLHLSKGERVWVEVGGTFGHNTIEGYRASDDAKYTNFYGFLVNAD